MDETQKSRFLGALASACQQCQMCELGLRQAERDIGGVILERDPHVFSNLACDSRFMVVGQNPGFEEVSKGEPFVGAAGKRFDQAVLAGGLTRSDFYITNATKCFTIGNAKPSRYNQERCSTWLQMEFNSIKPILVITLGASAFGVICPDLRFSDSLGKIVKSERFGLKVFPVYHPSPLNHENLAEFDRQVGVLCAMIIRLREQDNDVC